MEYSPCPLSSVGSLSCFFCSQTWEAPNKNRKSHSKLVFGVKHGWWSRRFHDHNYLFVVSWVCYGRKQQARARKRVLQSLLQYGKTTVLISEHTLRTHLALSASAPFPYRLIRIKCIIVAALGEQLL